MKLSAKQTASLAVRALLIVAVVFTADRVMGDHVERHKEKRKKIW